MKCIPTEINTSTPSHSQVCSCCIKCPRLKRHRSFRPIDWTPSYVYGAPLRVYKNMSHKRSSRWGDDSSGSDSDCGGCGSSSATLKRVSSATPSSGAPKRAKIASTGRVTQPSALPDDLPGPKIELDEAPMEMPNFALSGALAKDTTFGNTQNKTVLKHCEPPEARMPNLTWRSYVFEGDDVLRG